MKYIELLHLLVIKLFDTTILKRKGNQNKPQIKTVRDFDINF